MTSYIGSHLLKEVLGAGLLAVCLDDLDSGHVACEPSSAPWAAYWP